ncbi:hypothetical protein [Chryseobacterium gossypii]|uniref:hypothetical protein n=1 Tax=Chryseobacterium gossypii TaxID=3231602 RepID=UPI003526BB7A
MNKKIFWVLITALFSSSAMGQVGINSQNPQSTLDVTAKGGAGDIDGLQAPRLTRAQLASKGNTLYGSDQRGALIYITDISGGDALGPRINIDAAGYYFFDGAVWQKVGNGAGSSAINIYNSNGTLAADRVVTQDDKSLSFISTATTGTSHFKIDGTTFNVDAVNNRIGIGTATPTEAIDVNGRARIRTINSTAGAITDNIVAADPNGVLKVVSDLPRVFKSNSHIAPGASYTFATGSNLDFALIHVSEYDNCGKGMTATFARNVLTLNFLGGQAGAVGGEITAVNNSASSMSIRFPGVANCADGGNSTQFDFDISVNGNNNVTITNKGNVAKNVFVRVMSSI